MFPQCRVYWFLLVLPLLLLFIPTCHGLPHNRHLLQLADPYQTTHSPERPVTSVPSNDLPLDPYAKLLEQTIQKQSSLDVVVDDLLSQSLPPTGDEDTSHDSLEGGRHVIVDASRDGGAREADLDNMTSRSPTLKSLEDDEDEGLNAMIAWDVDVSEATTQASYPPTQPAAYQEDDLKQEGIHDDVVEVTTPAAHPDYQHQDVDTSSPKPWQSPMLGTDDTENKAPSPSLMSLVENQMNSYFPATGQAEEHSPDASASSSTSSLGQVRQSLAKALRQDLAGLLAVFAGKGESVAEKVNTLYEDYSMKTASSANSRDKVDRHDDDTPSQDKSQQEVLNKEAKRKRKPIDLKTFFAKYDFEVDADMMQEKILDMYQQSSREATDDPTEEITSKKQEPRKEDHVMHFHQSEAVPKGPNSQNSIQGKVCKKTHDLKTIFRNLDFEVDADKMEEKLHQFHQMKYGSQTEKPTERVQSEPPKPRPDLQNFLTKFDFEVDADEVTNKLYDFHTSVSAESNSHPPNETYKPYSYFSAEEKQHYDEESLDEFYTRFFSMKGTVIRAVALAA